MSELKLSGELLQSIQDVLVANDDDARDPGVAVQYLAAVSGYLLGMQEMDAVQKGEFLEQLYAFSRHVMDDVDQQRREAQPPAQQEAFGIWKPGEA